MVPISFCWMLLSTARQTKGSAILEAAIG